MLHLRILQTDEEQYLIIKIKRSHLRIPVNDILYLERNLRETTVHTRTEAYTVRDKLNVLQQQLPEFFVCCHRSFLLNLHAVSKLQHTEITLNTGQQIPVSRAHYEDVKKAFSLLMLWLQKTDFRISPLVSYSNPKKEGPLMPQFLKFILYSLLPGFFINSYICVRFCAGILTPSRIFFSKNRIRFFLSFMIPITAAGMSKYWFPSMGSWLIQLTVLLLTILYFSDPLKKKISTFLILICILAVSENIAATFALPIYTLIHHEEFVSL